MEFVPSNPLLSQTEEITPETPSESAVPLPLAESQAESNQADAPEVSESEIAEVTPARNSNANPLQPMETVTLPSMESVQRVLSSLQRSDTLSFTMYDCNKLEEEKVFSRCAPSDTRDYSSLTQNPVYDFHNPAIAISRSRETATTLPRQSARAARLE